MTTKYYSTLVGTILMTSFSAANATPISLSNDQMDVVSAGRSVVITAGASANGFFAGAQTGTIATAIGGSGYAVAMGNSGSTANTSGYGTGSSVAITNTVSGTFGSVAYSVTTVAVR